MAANRDDVKSPDSEAAAHRRWQISIIITLLLGGFGAVMAYLSYARSATPAAPAVEPSPNVVAPPAAEPGNDHGKVKPDKGK